MFANWEICWKRMVCVLLELNMVESYTFTKQKSKKKHGGHDSWLAVDLHQWWFFLLPLRLSFKMTHPRSLTVRPREVSFPKGKDHLPTIHFQGGFVKLWGVVLVFFNMNLLIFVPNCGPSQWLGGTPAVHRRRFRVKSWLRYHQQSYVSSHRTGGGKKVM